MGRIRLGGMRNGLGFGMLGFVLFLSVDFLALGFWGGEDTVPMDWLTYGIETSEGVRGLGTG